eukprot:gnl/TRDRNA2_/TRDRNA2_159609_c0_seq3.p1 gnl/TRDRNA2_/TRDRNA2_159609_c0~~gnl/TRDRNA2_/TRDRNA2_159609_c0_seq3.p1  ORF type:complete len:335 (+),score=62.18 gnl/TRDRNA2_/TRDRNA2_159609_c0_seq3:335-1339(+)
MEGGVEVFGTGKLWREWTEVTNGVGSAWVAREYVTEVSPPSEAIASKGTEDAALPQSELAATLDVVEELVKHVENLLYTRNAAHRRDEVEEAIDDKVVEKLDDKYRAQFMPANSLYDVWGVGPRARYEGGVWRCTRCGVVRGEGESGKELREVERWLGRLAEKTFFSPEMTPSIGAVNTKHHGGCKDNGGLSLVKFEFVVRAMDLWRSVQYVLGPWHWSAQWARITVVDLVLSHLSFAANSKCAERLALWHDILTQLVVLWEWLQSLGLAQDPSCFLYSRAKKAISLAPYFEKGSPAAERLADLKHYVECAKDAVMVEILPMRPLIIEGSISFQ